MHTATITNALIRCTRTDDQAASAGFERMRNVPGLWVLELETTESADLPIQVSGVRDQLARRLPELLPLRENSRDFTLHLAVTAVDQASMLIPPDLSEMAAECGFGIEILFDAGD